MMENQTKPDKSRHFFLGCKGDSGLARGWMKKSSHASTIAENAQWEKMAIKEGDSCGYG